MIIVGEFLLVGDRIEIRRFSLEDAYSMVNWGEHKNLLFEDYNFPFFDEDEIRGWFESKTFGWNKRYFSVYNESKHLLAIKELFWLLTPLPYLKHF